MENRRFTTEYCTMVYLILPIGAETISRKMGYSLQTFYRHCKAQGKGFNNPNVTKRFELLFTKTLLEEVKELTDKEKDLIMFIGKQYEVVVNQRYHADHPDSDKFIEVDYITRNDLYGES